MPFTIDYATERSRQRKFWSNLSAFFGNKATGNVIEKKTAVLEYDFAKSGGAIGTHDLGVSFPKGAVVTKVWYDVITTFTSATDAATISFGLNSNVDVKAAVAISDVSNPYDAGLKATIIVDTVATFVKTTAARTLKLVSAVEAITAGKVKVFVEYEISE